MADNSVDMTKGPIWRHLLVFSMPLLAGNFFQLMYNTVDTIVIGNYLGAGALAAVGTSFTIIGLTLVLFVGLGTGSGVVISQMYGAHDWDGMRRAVGTVAAFTVAAGIVMGALWVGLAGLVLRLTGVPDEIYDDAKRYLMIFFSAMPVGLAFNMGSGVLRAVGDSRTPLWYLIAATVTNMILDVWFTAYLGWGVGGVAFASALAQALSAVLVTIKLLRSDGPQRLDMSAFRIDRAILGRMLRIGVPAGLQSSMMMLSNVVIQTHVNSLGVASIAAWGVTSKIDAIVIQPAISFGMAVMTFTGQNFGARRIDRIRDGLRVNIALSVGIVASCSALIYAVADSVTRIFTADAEVAALAVRFLRGFVPFYVLVPIMRSLIGVINGVGHTVATLVVTIFCLCVLRVAYLAVAGQYLRDVPLLCSTYAVSTFVCVCVMFVYYTKGGWRKTLDFEQK